MERHPKSTYSPDIASIISQRLGISFLPDFDRQTEPQGNVCFAQSLELRPEYRDIFTLADLTSYLYGLSYSPKKKDLNPMDAQTFWDLVKIGNEFPSISKKENSLRQVSIELHPVLKHNWVSLIRLDGTGKLWINDLQYLTGISAEVWEMHLCGGYPAKKWLENHLGQELSAYKLDTYTGLLEHLNTVYNLMDQMVKRN